MILDYLTEFCANTAVAAGPGTAQVGDSLDLSAGLPVQTATRIGQDAGKQLHVHVTVTEAFAGVGASVQFQLMTDASDPVSGGDIVVASAVLPVANLAVGDQVFLTVPLGQTQRYLGLAAVVSGAALTAGSITSGMMFDEHGTYAYPDASN